MDKRKLRIKTLSVLGFLALTLAAGSAGATSYEVHNTTESIGGSWASGNTDFIIGPNAVITVNGDWYITAKNLYIHPSAQINGTGTLHIMNPSTYGATAATTNLDAGGVTIGCKVSIENGNTVTLSYIDPTTYGFAANYETHSAGTDNLVVSNSLNFNNAGAHVILGNNNVVFTNAAQAVVTHTDLSSGFTPDPNPGADSTAYFVTNGTGVVTKQGLAANTAFAFPVGQSVGSGAAYDYTPATATNGATVQDVNLAVKNYSGSTASELTPANGIDRSWQIYTSASAPLATLALTNNSSTLGASYNQSQAYITREQSTAGTWSAPHSTVYGGIVSPTGETGNPATLTSTSNTYYNNALVLGATTNDGTTPQAWYSKASGTGLSGNNVVAVKAYLQGALLSSASPSVMRNDLQTRQVLPASSATAYNTDPVIAYANINNTSGAAGLVTDWVEVQLRDATTPANIVETQPFLLDPNGNIKDANGNTSVKFSSPAGNYYVAIKHRNHLGAMTAAAQSLSSVATTLDFTSGSGIFGTNAEVNTSGAIFALRAGNADRTLAGGKQTVYYTATPSDVDPVKSFVANAAGNTSHSTSFTGAAVTTVYNSNDVNLDGDVRFTAGTSDVDIVKSVVTNASANSSHSSSYTGLIEQLP